MPPLWANQRGKPFSAKVPLLTPVEIKPMRVIGVDPGSLNTGYGVVELRQQGLHHLDCGRVRSPRQVPFYQRLQAIYRELAQIIEAQEPEVMAVENVFFARNPKSALKLGHVRGAVIVAGLNAGLEIAEYTPLEVKQALVGYGRAQKRQIQEMVRHLLALPAAPQEDAADALAVAICHLHSCMARNLLHGCY